MEQLAAEHPAEYQRRRQAGRGTHARQPHALAQHHAQDFGGLRAQGHADSQLLRARGHGIGDHSVKPDDGYQQSHGREHAQHRHHEAARRAATEEPQAPLARLLPALRFDADDPAASRILALSGIVDPRRRIPELQQVINRSPKSAEAKLRLADAMIAAGQPDAAIVLTDRILGDNEFEWRAHWYAGKALLGMANKAASNDISARATKGSSDPVALAKQAQGRFDRVYFEMPGELAPRLGIAMAAEVAKDFKTASLYYGRVEAIDPALASAVFGVARCRLELNDAAAAANALAAMPPSHSMYHESRLALACAYIAGDPVKNPDFLFKASDTLAALKTESAALHQVAAALTIRAVELLERRQIQADSAKRLVGVPLTPQALKLEAARRYAAVGRLAKSAAEKARWIDQSHAIRPLTLV